VESLVAAKLTEDTHLEEEVTRYWAECKDQNYVFDRVEKEVSLHSYPQNPVSAWEYKQFYKISFSPNKVVLKI
jgi:hypothetical protein